jgi:hypothetical protein
MSRKLSANRLADILITRGWQVRAAGPPERAYQRFWDFYRVRNSLVPLNPKAEAVMREFGHRQPDSNWPPDWER